jgi:16S rRNA (guanine966-N2)-methyltransferase
VARHGNRKKTAGKPRRAGREHRGSRQQPGSVRVIGGEWRGRRLPVVDLPGLRPSGDRTRETLFNWLQPFIQDAHCADLFAGSGALGLEAASRGAAEVTLIENTPLAMQSLAFRPGAAGRRRGGPGAPGGDRRAAWLAAREPLSLDIVFVDPPFDSRLEMPRAGTAGAARPGAPGRPGVHRNVPLRPPPHPGLGWDLAKEKFLGEVRMDAVVGSSEEVFPARKKLRHFRVMYCRPSATTPAV